MMRRTIADRRRIIAKQVSDEFALRRCLDLAADEIEALERKLLKARQKIQRLEQRRAKTGERPLVQVLKFKPELSHSIWADFVGRYQTIGSLEKRLKLMVKKGEIVGYRIGTALEVIGNV